MEQVDVVLEAKVQERVDEETGEVEGESVVPAARDNPGERGVCGVA
jgi:hypothetical protein